MHAVRGYQLLHNECRLQVATCGFIYPSVAPAGGVTQAPVAAGAPFAGAAGQPTPRGPPAICSGCGRRFPSDTLVYGLCPACLNRAQGAQNLTAMERNFFADPKSLDKEVKAEHTFSVGKSLRKRMYGLILPTIVLIASFTVLAFIPMIQVPAFFFFIWSLFPSPDEVLAKARKRVMIREAAKALIPRIAILRSKGKTAEADNLQRYLNEYMSA